MSPLLGIKNWLGQRITKKSGSWSDMLAGLSLASMNIPQVLGYARIAEMPAVCGLYTVLFPLVAFALFGSSRHLVVAADSATAAIFSSGLSEIVSPGSAKYMELVSAVALLNAGFLLVARLFRLGFLADFLSRTVLVGFLAGVGVQVGLSMLYDMTGLVSSSHNTLVQTIGLFQGFGQMQGLSMAIASLSCVVLLAGARQKPHWPVGLCVVVMSILCSWGLDLQHYDVAILGSIRGGLPAFSIPLPAGMICWPCYPFLHPVFLLLLRKVRLHHVPLQISFMNMMMKMQILWACVQLMQQRL